ncbi:MAG: hypothetical protein ACRD3J_11190 [Thermoanaerobaculia bacterium]
MRRAAIALLVAAGMAVPALVATVWLFGCCVLPFHRVMHAVAPLCHMAISQGSNEHSDQTATAPVPSQSAQRLDTELTQRVSFLMASHSSHVASSTPAAHRSYIALGALRCDRDVGLNTILVTFLI